MELINTADNPFDSISELLLLDHPGFYHGKSSCLCYCQHRNLCHFRQRPVTTPFAPENWNPDRTRNEIISSKTHANDSTLYLIPIARPWSGLPRSFTS